MSLLPDEYVRAVMNLIDRAIHKVAFLVFGGSSSGSAFRALAVVCVFIATVSLLAVADDSHDRVLDFYWGRAHANFISRDPLASGTNFSFRARTYYKEMAKGGRWSIKDSSIVDYYYSFGNLDSQKVIAGKPKDMPKVDLSFPNPFDSSYVLNSFPNDTGGAVLAIGFDNDTTTSEKPVGLAIIDRDMYSLHWLYLFYPDKPGYERFSRSFRFTEREGLVFADSVWQVVTENRLFFPVTYRLETGISNITIRR